jgi:hypothetical protein
MAESTGLMADSYVFTHFTRRVVVVVSAGSCGFVRSVRDAAAKYAQIGRLCAMLGIAAYSLNEMKGRVGAGRTRARYATRFLQPTLLRASPETPACFALRLSQSQPSLLAFVNILARGSQCYWPRTTPGFYGAARVILVMT